MSSSGQFSSNMAGQNNILARQGSIMSNNVSHQCPSEVMSNITVEDKISVLMSNQSQTAQHIGSQTPNRNENQDIYNYMHRQRRDSITMDTKNSLVQNSKVELKKLNKLLKMSILDKTSTTQNKVDNSYRVKEHHFMKSLYLHKLNAKKNTGENKDFTLQLKNSINMKKSSSQSVSGTDDKDKPSSHKSSKHFQPQVARSLCGGMMAEEQPLKTQSKLHFQTFKQLQAPQSVMLSGLNNDYALSEIGSVFQSQVAAEVPKKPDFQKLLEINLTFKSRIANKDMSLEQILKKDSVQKPYQAEDLPRLRRKICKKSFEIFYNEKKLEKNQAKTLSLVLENMINTRFNFEGKEYMRVIKSLFKSIRVRILLESITPNQLLEQQNHD